MIKLKGINAKSLLVAALSLVLSTTSDQQYISTVSALSSNAEESPQVLSDTSTVCSGASGRTDKCEVELDVPASCVSSQSSDCPIVFFLHGAGGTNDFFGKSSGVHSAEFIGIYPQGEDGWNTGPKNTNNCDWDDFSCTTDPDEGAFFAGIIAEVRSQGANGNIYVIGNSNGAALANRLAVNAGTDLPIAGIVAKVTGLLESPPQSGPGVLNFNQPSSDKPKVSVLNIMGTADGLIKYEGGSSGVFGGEDAFQLMSALNSMEVWATHNDCNTSPDVTDGISSDQGSGAIFYEYKDCSEGKIVEHYAIVGGEHNAGGASIDGEKIDYEIAFDFINRCEAVSVSGAPVAPSPTVTSAPSLSSSKAPSSPASTTNNPSSACEMCTDEPTTSMANQGNDCASSSFIDTKCNLNTFWVKNKVCQYSCFAAGNGYDGDNCCPMAVPVNTPTRSPGSAEVGIELPMTVVVDGVVAKYVPDDDIWRQEFASVITPALEEVSGGNDVVVKAINDIPLDNNVFVRGSIRAGVNVDFSVLLNIRCDGSDCSSALDAVSDLASGVVDQMSESMSDGSFVDAVVANAIALGVESLKEVTVDSSSFTSEDPIATPTTGNTPTLAPVPANCTQSRHRIENFLLSKIAP